MRSLKRNLFSILRSKNQESSHWPEHLQTATNLSNNRFNPGIGGLTPALVNKDIETGDNLIKDCLASIGKTSTNMLSIKEQK